MSIRSRCAILAFSMLTPACTTPASVSEEDDAFEAEDTGEATLALLSMSSFSGLGGQIQGSPGAAMPSVDHEDIYVRGMNNHLWQKGWNGWSGYWPSATGWYEHNDNSLLLGSSPSLVAGSTYRDLYVRGQDGGVYHKIWSSVSGWTGWYGLGGTIQGAPAVVEPTSGYRDIYVRGMDNRLWQKAWTGSAWWPSDLGWYMHDDGAFQLGSEPAVAASSSLRDIYVRGQDGGVYHKLWHSASGWSGWFGLGGQIKGAPTAVVYGANSVVIFVRGMDDHIYQKQWIDGQGWLPSDFDWAYVDSPPISSSPTVVTNGDFLDLFATDTSGQPIHATFDGGMHCIVGKLGGTCWYLP